MRRNVKRLVLCTAAALVLISGCGSAPPQRSEPPARSLTAAESDRLQRAEDMLTGRCMRTRGFTYTVLAQTAPPPIPDFPFGIDDVVWASTHGYGLRDGAALVEAQRDNANALYFASLPSDRQAAYDATLYGTPGRRVAVVVPAGQTVMQSVDGCLAEAQGQLYGDFARWFRAQTVTENLLPAIKPRVFADGRYQRALTAWSACVSAAGHAAASPDELRSQAAGGGEAFERALAVADATCNGKVGLAKVGAALNQELGAPIRARYLVQTQTYARMRLVGLARAAGIRDRNW